MQDKVPTDDVFDVAHGIDPLAIPANRIGEPGPSRTPRPAHPALLAADRLIEVLRKHFDAFTVEDVEAVHAVRRILWRIAEEDET